MAKCRVCGKIWSCSGEGVEMYYLEDGEEYQHCGTCRCDECRKNEKEVERKEMYYRIDTITTKEVNCPIGVKTLKRCKRCIWHDGIKTGISKHNNYVICKKGI